MLQLGRAHLVLVTAVVRVSQPTVRLPFCRDRVGEITARRTAAGRGIPVEELERLFLTYWGASHAPRQHVFAVLRGLRHEFDKPLRLVDPRNDREQDRDAAQVEQETAPQVEAGPVNPFRDSFEAVIHTDPGRRGHAFLGVNILTLKLHPKQMTAA